MKRSLCIALLLCLCISLTACGSEDPVVTFYYPRAEIQYGSEESFLVAEKRDTLSVTDELSYLLSFYLEGPISGDLALPFPANTRILELIQDETGLTLIMSREFAALEGMELTIACSSIAATCFSLCDTPQISIAVITAENIVCTVPRDGLILSDPVIAEAATQESTN